LYDNCAKKEGCAQRGISVVRIYAGSLSIAVFLLLCIAQPCRAQLVLPFGKPQEAANLKRDANALIEKERYSEALPLIKKWVELEREVYGDQDARCLDGLRVLGFTYYKLGRYREALSVDERRLRLSIRLLGEKHPDSISALRSLAVSYSNSDGDYIRALPLLEKALRLRTEALGEQHQETLALMTDVANAYGFSGREADALALYEKELRVITAAYGAADARTLDALLLIAISYSDMGRESEALPIFERIWHGSVAKWGEKNKNTIFNLVRVAGSYSRLNRNIEALKLMLRAMQLRKEVFPAKDRETIYFIEILAGIYMNLGHAADALPLYEEVVKLNAADAGEKGFVTLRSLDKLAHCHEVLGNLEEARKLYLHVLEIQADVQGAQHPDTILTMVNLANIERNLGHEVQARAIYEKAIPAIETVRAKGDLSPENRQVLFVQWVDAYKAYASLLVAAGNEQEGFRIAELSKARTLLESTAIRYADQSGVLTEEERNKARAFEWRIAKLNEAIVAAGNRSDRRLVLETDKNQAIAAFAAYRRELVAKHPKYSQLNEVKVLGADAGRAALPDDVVFVSYLLDGDRLLVFTLSSRDLQAQQLGSVPALARTIDAYRRLISGRSSALSLGESMWRLPDGSYIAARSAPDPEAVSIVDGAEIGRYLGQKLLDPLASRLSGWKRVIISADGPLAILPFETLPVLGTLLIAEHDVSYIQSLSMLALIKSRDENYRRSDDRKQLFAMGNAVYEATTPATRSAQPTEGTNVASVDVSKMLSRNAGDSYGVSRAFDLLHMQWPNLPGTETEIANVARIFGPGDSAIFTRQEATEAKLVQLNSQHLLSDFRYLLFSAHGFLSMEEPALSALVLGQVDKTPGTDGYVTAAKWPGYELRSDLVVLSACDTGLGKIIQGEGVMGLPYALYVAGNKNTLLSLWSVADESTAEFVTAFFAKLKAGIEQSAALNQTKREFITGSRFKDPFFWAPFVLYGY
jgi:CHAT domain-containing protein/tetratricopeptide (TPR) repeat protein